MQCCDKPLPKARNGTNRGLCNQNRHHTGKCGNQTCTLCGVKLDEDNTPSTQIYHGRRSGWCRPCNSNVKRIAKGSPPENYQNQGQAHTFGVCGCSGILPIESQSNKFAKGSGGGFGCRVSHILCASRNDARKRQYSPINPNIPHAAIRRLMDEPNCERCGEPLKWEFGVGKTPHLHHNHETGEPIGFTHPVCNPRAMENEIDRLRAEIKRLK